MKQNRIKGIRVGSSDHAAWRKELEDNHRILQEMVNNGWKIESASIKPRRKRIEKKPFKLFGTLECKFDIPIEILIKAGFA